MKNRKYGLYDDELYEGRTTTRVNYYVKYAEGRGEEAEPVTQCHQTLDWMQVILISVGSGCGLFAIGFITYFVVVNVKDYMELKAFRKARKGIWNSENVVEPGMRKSSDSQKRKSVRNRLSVKFSNK